ncbi:MAG: dihydroorotate dehydrogenase electron transfer subunit [Tannerellaceae bacterium]|jgi:dihydroorotate dehydrogenase electron transfer subunit|nr:dihydroorotate dehydrogenase electron transfer subunit [Tannerellaceae bacterium]
MKKYMLDLKVTENRNLHASYCLLKLTSDKTLPDMFPGQFVQVLVNNMPTTFLRRPISINYIDKNTNELWLLIKKIGDGTQAIANHQPGDYVNLLLPLGNSFTLPATQEKKHLLIGGGVGTAPMLFMGAYLRESGFEPTFLLGARSKKDLMQLDVFQRFGTLYTTTEDGSHGETGFVINHSILTNNTFDRIYTCGPKPMMMAIAKYAAGRGISCEVSLENTMACGIGACLCCVENTTNGHTCVCTEGPVFNINKLTWQI